RRLIARTRPRATLSGDGNGGLITAPARRPLAARRHGGRRTPVRLGEGIGMRRANADGGGESEKFLGVAGQNAAAHHGVTLAGRRRQRGRAPGAVAASKAASVDLRSVPEITAAIQWPVMTYWPVVLISAVSGMVLVVAVLVRLRRD